MAVQAFTFRTYVNGEPALPMSTGMEPLFKSLSVTSDGTDQGLKLSSTGTKFDFNGKVLANAGAATANGELVEYAQFNTALADYILLAEKGAANGVAPLDGSSRIPVAYMPVGVDRYLGTWDASTNTPSLANGTGRQGDFYITKVGANDVNLGPWFANAVADVTNLSAVVTVTQAGHQLTSGEKITVVTAAAIGGISSGNLSRTATAITVVDADTFTYVAGAAATSTASGTLDEIDVLQSFNSGDWVFYDGSVWEQVSNSMSVTSVNGQTGVVVLDTDDIAEGATNLYFTTSRARTAAVADAIVDGVTDVAPSQNAVFDALALKADKSDDYATMQNNQGGAVAITVRQFVYMSAFGQVKLADASIAVTSGTWLGCVRDATIGDTASGTVWRPHRGTVIEGFTGLTYGLPVFLSHATPGGYTQDPTDLVAGDRVVFLGYPESATSLSFAPEYQGALS